MQVFVTKELTNWLIIQICIRSRSFLLEKIRYFKKFKDILVFRGKGLTFEKSEPSFAEDGGEGGRQVESDHEAQLAVGQGAHRPGQNARPIMEQLVFIEPENRIFCKISLTCQAYYLKDVKFGN